LGILGHTEAQAQLGGVPLWTNRYNGPRSDLIYYDYKVDGGGNVFVTGESYGTTNSFADYLTLKYSSALPPSLAIARTATNTVAVSWPSPWSGWSLQMMEHAQRNHSGQRHVQIHHRQPTGWESLLPLEKSVRSSMANPFVHQGPLDPMSTTSPTKVQV
jgi:hypothetical protein